MAVVTLVQVDGPEIEHFSMDFAVAPSLDQSLILKARETGKRHFFRVLEIIHAQNVAGGMDCVATISWDGAVSASPPERRAALKLIVDNEDADER